MGVDLSEGDIVKTILKTSIPMVVAFLLQSTFNIVDAFFVGKISSEALAAVSISFPIVFLIISLGSGIGAGTASVVARYIGGKKYKKADNASEHALIATFIIGVFLSIGCLLTAPTLFNWIGAEENVKTLAIDYINILLFFAAFMLLSMVASSILRGEGDMETPMKVMGFSAILNAIVDPIFIFTLGLGVRGAAIATIFSRTFGFLYLMYYLLSGKSWIKLDYRDFKYDFDYIKKVFSVGIPSSLSNISMSFGMFLITIIVGFYGTDALAAYGIGFRLDALAVLPAMGVSIAVVSIVGQSLGAGKIERARTATLKAGVMASAFMTAIGLIFCVFAGEIIKIFNTETSVVEHGTTFLHIIPLSYLVVGVAICASSAFIGSGKAMLALISTILRVIVFTVPAAYLLSLEYGVEGIWRGMVVGSFLGFLATMFFFRYGKWEKTGL